MFQSKIKHYFTVVKIQRSRAIFNFDHSRILMYGVYCHATPLPRIIETRGFTSKNVNDISKWLQEVGFNENIRKTFDGLIYTYLDYNVFKNEVDDYF